MALRGNPKTCDTYVPTGRIWPCGDFSVGYRRVEGDGAARIDDRSHCDRIDAGDYVLPGDDWEHGPHGFPRPMPGIMSASEKAACDRFHEGVADGAKPLTLAIVPNSHTPKNRPEKYGKNGITGYGKRMIKSAATLIQKRFTRQRTTFCTISMPQLPENLRAELARCWPEYVRQLVQYLNRQLERQGLPPAVCSVTEVQPKRLEQYGEAYLHLHLVWGNKMARSGHWAIAPADVRSWSERFLRKRGLWNDAAWVRVNVQPVKKSAAAYLAKYMSKGVSEIEALAEDLGWDAVPSQWWNMSKYTRDWVKAELVEGDVVGHLLLASVEMLFRCGGWHDMFHSLHEAVLEWDGRTTGVGWFGCLRESYRNELLLELDMAS